MSAFLRVLRDIALLLARVGLGWILVLHGWRRWQQLGIESQAEYLRQFGVPYADYAAWGAAILELVGGIFLIVGALTPLIAAAVLVEQVLIICYTNWYKGFALINTDGSWNGGYEYNVVLGLLALLLLVYGSGRVGIDRLFHRSKADDEDDSPEPESEPTTTPN